MIHNENKNTSPTAATEPSPQMAAFIERLRRHTETYGSALHALFEREGNSDAFRDALDDLAAEIAFEDPEYAANAARLRNTRLGDEEAKDIMVRQRAMANEIKQLIIQEAGIPTEEIRTEIEKAQATVLDRLQGVDLTTAQSDELLRKLGILREDENGDTNFHYPDDLFPESVTTKWELYLAAVENHMKIGSEIRRGERAAKDLETADIARHFAHNRVSEDIHKILGFNNLPDEQWDFEATRRLVAKMREQKFVGKETSEAKVTNRALARGIGALGLSVVGKLSQRKSS